MYNKLDFFCKDTCNLSIFFYCFFCNNGKQICRNLSHQQTKNSQLFKQFVFVIILKEHFYDAESGSGYLAWRLKTIQRKSASSTSRDSSSQLTDGGPTARRDSSYSPEMTLSKDQCREAVSLMKHCSDDATIKQKMKMTFEYRRNMIFDPEKSSDVLTEFPRFKDIKGLVIEFLLTNVVLKILCVNLIVLTCLVSSQIQKFT